MALISILITLALQFFFKKPRALLQTDVIDRYLDFLAKFFADSVLWKNYFALIFILLPIIVIVGVIDVVLRGWLFHILEIIFSVIVLYYCLMRGFIHQDVLKYFAALKADDEQAAFLYASQALDLETIDNTSNLKRTVSTHLLQHALISYFSILFWFIVLGPVGAVMYDVVARVNSRAGDENLKITFSRESRWFQNLLDWIPSRLLGLSFALVGHFGAGFGCFWQNFATNINQVREYIVKVGFAALELDLNKAENASDDENQVLYNLIKHALIVWLVVIALFTI